MFYKLTLDAPIVVKVQPGAAVAIEDKLRNAHLPYEYQTEQDEARIVRHGLFTVTPSVTASVRILPDYRRQLFQVTLRNVDRFESVILEFVPEKLDETALEDLVRFMLGEASTFLRRAPLAGLGHRRSAEAAASPSAG
jgi:hypothetical protein